MKSRMKALILLPLITGTLVVAAASRENLPVYAPQANLYNLLAKAEQDALASSEFQSARSSVVAHLFKPEYIGRTVLPFAGQRTFNPTDSYLVVERWYGQDSYVNILAEVSYRREVPVGLKPTVRIVSLQRP